MQESDHQEDSGPSKSQRKRDMHALQELGEELVKLSKERLAKIAIDDNLREAVRDAQRIPGRSEALRRQMQYIGKLMRDADPTPIKAALDAVKGVSRAETARMHRLERLRERLIEDEKVIGEIATQYPGADLQQLRQMRRNAIREKELNRPPRAFREIYQALRELDLGGGRRDDDEYVMPDEDEADE
ncbi:ribosome biogenesis factor YjgA [Uliginosibacterium sp. H3]|uniref:Dual-action ribosomal maturation protein DarP n=1 Tax=Uliginosibacterium silvisoli TaxID=3114758 RepID=A0ABU6K3I4_9RHOO|nr:ribosome biogenesis factor YjgA [Uliginosibacterium sp. H3]